MKTKYSNNRTKLSQEQLSTKKDFSKVLNTASAKKISNKKRLIKNTLFSIAIVGLITSFFIWQNKKTDFVAPPLPGLEKEFSSFYIDNTRDTMLVLQSGTEIYITHESLLDKNGVQVSGEVEIRYREYRDLQDIFLSGIPMIYTDESGEYHFESDGMFEIMAYQAGELVFIKPNKTIEVKMVAISTANYYNTYFFNQTTGQWEFLCKDQPDTIYTYKKDSANVIQEIAQLNAEIETLTDNQPIKPIPSNPEIDNIKIEYKSVDYPELVPYTNVLFEIAPQSQADFNQSKTQTKWRDVEISRINKENLYKLKFSKPKEIYEVFSTVVFDQFSLADAQLKYDQYQQAIKDKATQKQLLERQYQAERITAERTIEKGRQEAELANRIQTSEAISRKIMRTFIVDKFGIYNCDFPQKLPQGMIINANFADESGNPILVSQIHLADIGSNTLYTYFSSSFNNFKLNPDATCVIWGVTMDGNLAVYEHDRYKRIPRKAKALTFTMTIHSELPATNKDVKKLLYP